MPTLLWDVTRQAPTLGGALTLRMEAELLAADFRVPRSGTIQVVILDNAGGAGGGAHLLRNAFTSSAWAFELLVSGQVMETTTWPRDQERAAPGFSYFAYERVNALYQKLGLRPRLSWNSQIIAEARKLRQRFRGRLYAVHLRRTFSEGDEMNNADGRSWSCLLQREAKIGHCEFLLLGDDPLPPGMTVPPGVWRAKELGIPLMVQLAVVSLCEGYLGMASGLGTAANFSEVPHVLFKHPAHHAEEMNRELGHADRYPFFNERQELWRVALDETILAKAWRFITQ